MQKDNLYPSELEITAHHEAGHAVVAKMFKWPVAAIVLDADKAGNWGGRTVEEPDYAFDIAWNNLDLDHLFPYEVLRLRYPARNYSDNKAKISMDSCTYKYAGIVAETLLCEQLGVSRRKPTIISDEDSMDMREVKAKIEAVFSPEEWEHEQHNAEAYAKGILSSPACWRLVVNLATELVNAIREGRKQAVREGDNLVYRFNDEEIYASFARTMRVGLHRIDG